MTTHQLTAPLPQLPWHLRACTVSQLPLPAPLRIAPLIELPQTRLLYLQLHASYLMQDYPNT